jgi:hypothetical protein
MNADRRFLVSEFWYLTSEFALSLCCASVQDHRFRDVVSLRRLCPAVIGFAAASGVLTLGFCLLTFDLRVRRAL